MTSVSVAIEGCVESEKPDNSGTGGRYFGRQPASPSGGQRRDDHHGIRRTPRFALTCGPGIQGRHEKRRLTEH